jgi:hypothetical protein
MKHLNSFLSAAIAAGTFVAGWTIADDKPRSEQLDPKVAEMMKKAEAAATPGASHRKLDHLVGEWTAEVKCWMAPDAPPTVTTGTAKSSWVMNGRFVQQEFNGEFMGKPFHGMSFTGYDNVRGKYNSVWVDDMSTTMFTSEGEVDAEGKVFTFTGSYSCALTGEKHKTARQVYRILSRDKHIFEMHDLSKPGASKTMEITYVRKGSGAHAGQAAPAGHAKGVLWK